MDVKKRYLSARKNYISAQFAQLNEMQRQAVMTTQGPLLLLAGAGSGKTTVLINRIANLLRFGCGSDSDLIPADISEADVLFLENVLEGDLTEDVRERADWLCSVDPVAPWNVIAITFTNKAANELKERLSNMLQGAGEGVWAMTFHSACCRILRKDIDRLGYGKSFTIYDSSDSERLMKDIVKSMGLDEKTFPAKYVLGAISMEKDKYSSPDRMLRRAETNNDLRAIQIAKAYQTYQRRLKENNALDFDDIIYLTVKLLQENEDVRQYYQRKFRYVLVDEYQDTNHLQYLLTNLLAGGYHNICVVGDDDQSIYRFRGATIENILNFEKVYPGARLIRLEQNYRSTQSILNAANAVISHNIGRKGKRLWTANGSGAPILVYEAADQDAEANYVAGQILSRHKHGGFRENAILYRTNAQSNALEYALKRNGIPYRVIGGTRFFDRAEIKDMLSYLCVINNRADDLRLKRIINNPPRGLGAKTIENVERLSQAEGVSMYHVVSDPYSYGPLEKAAAKLLQFTVLIEDLAQLLEEGMPLAEFYDRVMDATGYVAMLEAKPTDENQGRLDNIRELRSSIKSYADSAEDPTLAGFLEEIALYTDIEQYNESDDAAVMMTIHSAKGLEFSNVYLVGFEDGLFPGMRAIGDYEEMEEERRLCYVAITRAKDTLTISHARQRMLYGRTGSAMPSRFLKEMPEDCIVRKGGYQAKENVRPFPPLNKPHSGYLKNHISSSSVPTAFLELNKGDMVEHSAFGRGMVLSVMKLSGDALLEVAFDQVGTKKLMAKAASAHLKKI